MTVPPGTPGSGVVVVTVAGAGVGTGVGTNADTGVVVGAKALPWATEKSRVCNSGLLKVTQVCRQVGRMLQDDRGQVL